MLRTTLHTLHCRVPTVFMRSVHLLVLWATSWPITVADRSRLDIGKHLIQDGVVAVAVGYRHQVLSPARSRADLEPLAKDPATPRIVQSSGLRPAALAEAPSSSGDTPVPALSQRWRNVTNSRGLFADQMDRVPKRAAWTIGKRRKDVLPVAGEPKDPLQDAGATPVIRIGGSDAMLQAGMQESGGGLGRTQEGHSEAAVKPSSRSRGSDETARERKKSATSSMRGGSEAVFEGVGELVTLMRDADAGVRKHAASTIGRGGGKSVLLAVDALKALLNDVDHSVRAAAAAALKGGGPEAVLQALPKLKHLLQDDAPQVRARARVSRRPVC